MSLQVEDFFPPCNDPNCLDRGKHKHLLPHQREIIESPAKYLYVQGGVGAAKTLPGCIVGAMLSINIAGNRGFIGRRTYSKLHEPTWRMFLEVLERVRCEYKGYENRDGFPHRIVLTNGSEVVARETKDLGRFLGPEYGWFLVDEAVEEPEETFKGLRRRLRLALAGRHLKGMLLSNPPPQIHWLHDTFGDHPGVREVVVDMEGRKEATTFHFMKVSTRANPHLPKGYLSDLLAGASQSEISRIVEGEYGAMLEGRPVYSQFQHNIHVGMPELKPVELIRGWDFGFNHPAVTWHQHWNCKLGKVHWTILAETGASIRSMEAPELADRVFEQTSDLFPNVPRSLWLDGGDASGAEHRSSGLGPIYQLAGPPWRLQFRHSRYLIEPGVRGIRTMLRMRCECGQPAVLVHRRCVNVIQGFAGGYRLPRTRPDKAAREEPYKDGFYDDYMDSVRYAYENFVRVALFDTQRPEEPHSRRIWSESGEPAWAWLERTGWPRS